MKYDWIPDTFIGFKHEELQWLKGLEVGKMMKFKVTVRTQY